MPGFAGFDTSAYPGDGIMSWLKANTNLVWCGFYLAPSPSHPGTTWMNKRAFLQNSGWGIAPLYVGQQLIGPGSHHTSAHQGYADGTETAQLMNDAGFPQGTYVYLDLENGLPFPPLQQAYVKAWVDQIEHLGYGTGVYCSHSFAAQLHNVVPSARIWLFKVSTTAPHPVPGPHYPDNHPGGSGYAGAYVWQLGQHCLISVPGAPNGRLTVDLDTAVTADPSAPTAPPTAANLVAATAAGASTRGTRRRRTNA